MPERFQNLNRWRAHYNAKTYRYDYTRGTSFSNLCKEWSDPVRSDFVKPTWFRGSELILNGGAPCLVDTNDRYHRAGNALGVLESPTGSLWDYNFLGLTDFVLPISSSWLRDEAVARLAGNYDVLMNTRSWYDAARTIDGWARDFWSLYRNLRRNPRRAWRSMKRFAKRFFHRSLTKAPKELVSGLPTAAREYCAIKYGALPIIHDLRDTLKKVLKPKPDIRVVATARYRSDPTPIYVSDDFGGIKTWRFTESYSAIAVRYISADSIGSYGNFGDLIQTPLYTVWDAIPWSFVIDWFLPVGNALLQVQPFGFNVTRGFDCVRYRGRNVLQVSDSTIALFGSNVSKLRYFERWPNSSMALGLSKAISHYITDNEQMSYVRQVGHHLIDLYALGRSRLH